LFLVFACAAMQVMAPSARAQDRGGSLYGVIRDASLAVLSDTVIEARSPSMPGVATTVSDGNGVYRFPLLRPGTYELTARHTGSGR
jgi:hypothetical protein